METENLSEGQKPRSFIEQARRAQIIEAAVAVVAEQGYARASLARIAEHAGISKGVVTYHFSGKDEILHEVVTRFFNRGWEFMAARIDQQPSAVGQVRAWISAEIEFFGQHRTEFLAMSEIMQNHRGADGSHAFAGELAEETTGLAEVLAAGQRAGELRDFDPHSVARILSHCVNGVLGAWAINPAVDLTSEAETLLDFASHAIRGEQS